MKRAGCDVRANSAVRSARSRWRAILGQRCPRCLEGKVYAGALRMHDRCPACGHRFQREPGYFLGAMYISYPLSIVVIALATLVLHYLWPDLRLDYAVMWSVVPLLVCTP